MLKVSIAHNPKAFVADLIPNSGSNQLINDEFRNAYQGVNLWSFYETMATSLGLIVSKESAVLGLPGERIQLLNADHRHVCKFETPSDSNYIVVRNAFAHAIGSIETTALSSRKDQHSHDMNLLSHYLGIEDRSESDLVYVLDKRIEGSCQWLTAKEDFQQWHEGPSSTNTVYWLQGELGTGKSVIAGHVLEYLRSSNSECSYFSFKHGDSAKSTAAMALCYLAWQMAYINMTIRTELLSMQADEEKLDRNDERALWRTLFASRIFRAELRRPHFFVLDALDECRGFEAVFSLLAKVDRRSPIRIFLTSRPSRTLDKLFADQSISHFAVSIDRASIKPDIELLVRSRAQHLPVDTDQSRESLIEEILLRSGTSFLWTSLVLPLLEDAMSEHQTREILTTVPTEMSKLYSQILESITITKNAKLASAMFRWAVCAVRPLTTVEMSAALVHDIGETLSRFEKNVGAVTCNLIYVDSQLHVRLSHQTFREYLLKECDVSTFSLQRSAGHLRLAEVLLEYLCGNELKTARNRRVSTTTRGVTRSPIAAYAACHFTEHVVRAPVEENGLTDTMGLFLSSNSLTWIEMVADGGDLQPVTQAAKNLKIVLDRIARHQPLIGKSVQIIESWIGDLIHLVAQYGSLLCSSPTSIHFLVPPLCPPSSAISSTFHAPPRSLRATGLSQTGWDDRLYCERVQRGVKALSLAAQSNRFAVGLSSGRIEIYNEYTCQPLMSQTHAGPVYSLRFANTAPYLVSFGADVLCLWDFSKAKLLWSADDVGDLLSSQFDDLDQHLLCTTRDHELLLYDVLDGHLIEGLALIEDDAEEPPPAERVALSPRLDLILIAQRLRPVTIWSIDDHRALGSFYKSGVSSLEPPIAAIALNPNEDIGFGAAAYLAGDVVVFDPWTQEKIAEVPDIFAVELTSSPDGNLLASGSARGAITVFEFETLRTLYRINSDTSPVRAISFNATGNRILETRSDRLNVWEPSVLVRRSRVGDESSISASDDYGGTLQETTLRISDDARDISSLLALEPNHYIICGRADGSVAAYSSADGNVFKDLFTHRAGPVACLAWNASSSSLASTSDQSLQIHQLIVTTAHGVELNDGGAPEKWPSIPRRLLFSSTGRYLLVSTDVSDDVVNLVESSRKSLDSEASPENARSWAQHPSKPNVCVLATAYRLATFAWDTGDKLTSVNIEQTGFAKAAKILTAQVWTTPQCRTLCLGCSGATDKAHRLSLVFSSSALLEGGSPNSAPQQSLAGSRDDCIHIIGTLKSRLIFLSNRGWVCSVAMDTVQKEAVYTKHFWIPPKWHTIAEHLLMAVTSSGVITLAVADEIVVFHHGLDSEEKVWVGARPPVSAKPSIRATLQRGRSDPP